MIKRILIITITILIAISGFLTGFFSVGCMSVYAAVNDDSIYVPLRSENDAVKAFQAYCKSRDLTIEGSLADAVTTFTTGAFNSACNEIGIDITELQAEIKAEYDQAGNPVKFLFNDTGVMAMNRIFAQFLQDNELEVGDEANQQNNTLYDGRWFVDFDGNGCLVYKVASNNSILEEGTTYKFNINDMQPNGGSYNFNLTTIQSYTLGVYRQNYSGSNNYRLSTAPNGGGSILFQRNSAGVVNYNFARIVVGSHTNGDLYLGCVTYFSGAYDVTVTENLANARYSDFIKIENGNANNCIIFLTTFNTVINDNDYEGDTIINNEGDIINNPVPEQPNDPNDTIHNVPETPLSPNDDGGWDIDLPDIDIPNLPIGNLSEKFPFSIPWDLVAFYAMLDAEPEAPRFNGTMDLTLVQWNYDIDLSPFDSAAELCRKLQFGLFVVGLIVASRSIIRG